MPQKSFTRLCQPFSLAIAVLWMGSLSAPHSVVAADLLVEPFNVTDWKSVYATVEPSVRVAARTRTPGTVVELVVDEGSTVNRGDRIARVLDEKLAPRRLALAARISATAAEATNIESEVGRARQLFARGTISQSRIDELETQLDIARQSLRAAEAELAVLDQQEREGDVIAASDGRVLSVPVALGSVVLPGETVAMIAEDDFLLRLELPERHAGTTRAGDPLRVAGSASGEIVKVYPELRQGRVVVDAKAGDLARYVVGERIAVEIGTGTRTVIALPEAALTLRGGLDYVRLRGATGSVSEVVVQRGRPLPQAGTALVEILSGVAAGDVVVLP